MSEGDDERPEVIRTVRLEPWQRVVSALVAIAMIGFTPFAIWRGHDGLATSTLVLAGLVLAAVALAGPLPGRISWNGLDVEMAYKAGRQQGADDVVEALPSSQVEPAMVAIRELGGPSSDEYAATRLQARYEFEKSVTQTIMSLVGETSWNAEVLPTKRTRFLLQREGPDPNQVEIVTAWGMTRNQARSFVRTTTHESVLLVTSSEPTREFVEHLEFAGINLAVFVGSPDGIRAGLEALTRLAPEEEPLVSASPPFGWVVHRPEPM